jgi:hypothetical protein
MQGDRQYFKSEKNNYIVFDEISLPHCTFLAPVEEK